MKHLLKYSIVVLLLITAFSCKPKEETNFGNETGKLQTESDPTEVSVLEISLGDFPIELVSNGKLAALKKADLIFKSNDIITKIYVKNGQKVNKGSLIAELDKNSARNNRDQARVTLDSRFLELTSLIIGSDPGAKDSTDISPDLYETFTIRSGYKQAELDYQARQSAYENTTLKAPFSGRIANMELKEYDNPGGKVFCKIIDDSGFDIMFPVLETELGFLKTGMEIRMAPYNSPEDEYFGKVTEINPVVDEYGLVKVKAFVKNSGGKLFEGMNVKIYARDKVPNSIVVPKKSVVIRNTNRDVVFLYKNGKAIWRYVLKIRENSTDYIIIPETEGEVIPGDSIIVEGNLNLGHDANVVLKNN